MRHAVEHNLRHRALARPAFARRFVPDRLSKTRFGARVIGSGACKKGCGGRASVDHRANRRTAGRSLYKRIRVGQRYQSGVLRSGDVIEGGAGKAHARLFKAQSLARFITLRKRCRFARRIGGHRSKVARRGHGGHGHDRKRNGGALLERGLLRRRAISGGLFLAPLRANCFGTRHFGVLRCCTTPVAFQREGRRRREPRIKRYGRSVLCHGAPVRVGGMRAFREARLGRVPNTNSLVQWVNAALLEAEKCARDGGTVPRARAIVAASIDPGATRKATQ